MKSLIFCFLIFLSTKTFSNTVKCLNKKECPEALAKIVGTENGQSWKCTGFLISENILATNKHCLPEALMKNKSANCAGTLTVHFPETQKAKAENIGCLKVLDFSDDKLDGNVVTLDYAFLELDRKLSRAPMKISHAGIKDQEILTFWRVDEIEDSVVRKDKCTSSYQSLFFPFTDSYDDPVMTLVGCSADHGNSGSPLLNLKGEVVAILEGKTNQVAMDFFKEKFQEKNLVNIVKSSNLACISVPGENSTSFPESCKMKKSDDEFFIDGNAILKKAAEKNLSKTKVDLSGVTFKQGVVYRADYAEKKVRRDNLGLAKIPECLNNLERLKSKVLDIGPSADQKYYSVLDLNKMNLCLVDFEFSSSMKVKKVKRKCSPHQAYLLLNLKNEESITYYYTLMDLKTKELVAFSESVIPKCNTSGSK